MNKKLKIQLANIARHLPPLKYPNKKELKQMFGREYLEIMRQAAIEKGEKFIEPKDHKDKKIDPNKVYYFRVDCMVDHFEKLKAVHRKYGWEGVEKYIKEAWDLAGKIEIPETTKKD